MSAVLHAREPSARYLEAAQPTLVRQFELLAMAPGGVARLRELILVLAVQGKLTRRDALAEPAPALLARILKQKESLIAAGKIKRDKPLLAIDEADRPFDIPQSWCWVRLGGVTNYGSPTKGESIGPETWVLDLEDIEKSTGRLLHRVRRSERPSLSEKNSFQAGDVLYGKLRPYLNKVIVADEPGVCTTELVPFRCYGDWVPQYFKTALSSPPFLEYVNARSYGMKMPRLGTEDARTALLPLPPLEEQARIVARVDELMRLCDALEAKGRLEAEQHGRLLGTLLGTLTDSSTPDELAANWQRVADHFDQLLDRPAAVDALEQTILQLAVRGLLAKQDLTEEPAIEPLRRLLAQRAHKGHESRARQTDPGDAHTSEVPLFDLPAGWTWAKAEDLSSPTSIITYGVLKPEWVEVGVPTVRVQDIQAGSLRVNQVGHCSPARAAKFGKTELREGDLLIAKDGATLGKTAFVPKALEGGNITQHVLRFSIDVNFNRDYVRLVIDSPHGQDWMRGETQGVALPGVNVGDFRRMPVPLPPIREQARIISRVTELRRICAELRQRLDRSGTKQASLADALIEQALSA